MEEIKLNKEKIDNNIELAKALKNPENWNPNLTKLSKALNVPLSTVNQRIKKLGHRLIVEIRVEITKLAVGEEGINYE